MREHWLGNHCQMVEYILTNVPRCRSLTPYDAQLGVLSMIGVNIAQNLKFTKGKIADAYKHIVSFFSLVYTANF